MGGYGPPTGYVMPQPQCIPPNTYQMPADPNVYDNNVVWSGIYEQDGEDHEMAWTNFSAAPGQVLRGKGRDDNGHFILQGYVE